jgi:hypothetical protein
LDLDGAEQDPGVMVSEADAAFFDRRWAVSLLSSAPEEVARDYAARGRKDHIETLPCSLPGAQELTTYQAGAARAGVALAAFKSELHRVRLRLRETVRARVALTVSAPHEIESELSYLSQVLIENQASPHFS